MIILTMSTLYIVGGSPRAGKTTIVEKFLEQNPIPSTSTDALRAAMRNALFDEPYVTAEKLSIKGNVEFRRPGYKERLKKSFSSDIPENELAWKAAVGLIDHYDRRNQSLILDGMVFDPEQVRRLKLTNLAVKVLFVGYNSVSHADTIIEHAKGNPYDWINDWLGETEGDEKEIRDWVATEVDRSNINAQLATKYGYGYFDITIKPFNEHIDAALNYLCQK